MAKESLLCACQLEFNHVLEHLILANLLIGHDNKMETLAAAHLIKDAEGVSHANSVGGSRRLHRDIVLAQMIELGRQIELGIVANLGQLFWRYLVDIGQEIALPLETVLLNFCHFVLVYS